MESSHMFCWNDSGLSKMAKVDFFSATGVEVVLRTEFQRGAEGAGWFTSGVTQGRRRNPEGWNLWES